VITSILYIALSGLSASVLNAIAERGTLMASFLLVAGIALMVWYALNARYNAQKTAEQKRKPTKRLLIIGLLCILLGFFGLLQAMGVLEGVPVLALGIPAVLSCYFDLFSGFVQAYVFTLLTMVYIGNSCPPPEESGAGQ
jgi:F-type H+-transporting ATPase subunit a